MKETLDIKLSADKTSVQLIGYFSLATIQFPDTIDKLLCLCDSALQKHYQRYRESILIVNFIATAKISSVGFSDGVQTLVWLGLPN